MSGQVKVQIEDVRKHRDLYRQRRKRSAIPVIAIVGYTNAGKSTLFNSLSQADVLVEDKVFATLDPTTRRIKLADNEVVLLTDTVGFIRKLPPTIVSAFRATLEELAEASLLLHVVDISSPYSLQQSKVVEETLVDLNLAEKPRITILNKVDLLLPSGEVLDENKAIEYLSNPEVAGPPADNTILVSAVKKWGFKRLVSAISEILKQSEKASVFIPQK